MQSVCIWVFLNILNDTRNFLFFTKGLCLFNFKEEYLKNIIVHDIWDVITKRKCIFPCAYPANSLCWSRNYFLFIKETCRKSILCAFKDASGSQVLQKKCCLLNVYMSSISKEKFTYNISADLVQYNIFYVCNWLPNINTIHMRCCSIN